MPEPPIEGVDFYLEKGVQIFYAAYLLKRGYCCKTTCKHCPYGYRKPTSKLDKFRRNSEDDSR